MRFPPRCIAIVCTLLAWCPVALCQVPRSNHVYIVAEENHSYEHLVGSADMPYLNSLINQNGLATQFYANQHSSLPNYFWVTSGQPITEDNETTLTFDVDNIVRRVMQRGLTYKSYAQSLPYAGYAGLYSGDAYLKRHAPLPYYSDMGNSPTEMLKHVPIDQLSKDIASGNLPNFAFITPDSQHDMHDCPTTESACEQQADQFLKQYIAPLLARPEFQPGGDGLLIIWADEADLDTDNRCSATVADGCGGRILVSLIGPKVKSGYASTTTYHHESVLRTMLEALGVTGSLPGAADGAPDMAEFFGNTVASQLNVTSPASGATVSSPAHVVASAQAQSGIDALQIYVDGNLTYTVQSASMDTLQALTPGSHNLVIKAWDKLGNAFSQPIAVTATAPGSISILSPAANSTVGSATHVVTSATSPNSISATWIYVDDQVAFKTNSASVDTTLQLSAGTHNIQAQAWDITGAVFISNEHVTVQAAAQITVVSPAAGSTVNSPMHVLATGTSPNGVAAMQIYSDGQLVYSNPSSTVDAYFALTAGAHNLTIKMWDSKGSTTKQTLSVTVKVTPGVTLISPATGSTVGSSVRVVAAASTGKSSNPIGAMRVYVDYKSIFTVQTDHIDQYVTLSSGPHLIVVVAWDQVGASMTRGANVTVP